MTSFKIIQFQAKSGDRVGTGRVRGFFSYLKRDTGIFFCSPKKGDKVGTKDTGIFLETEERRHKDGKMD